MVNTVFSKLEDHLADILPMEEILQQGSKKCIKHIKEFKVVPYVI